MAGEAGMVTDCFMIDQCQSLVQYFVQLNLYSIVSAAAVVNTGMVQH